MPICFYSNNYAVESLATIASGRSGDGLGEHNENGHLTCGTIMSGWRCFDEWTEFGTAETDYNGKVERG